MNVNKYDHIITFQLNVLLFNYQIINTGCSFTLLMYKEIEEMNLDGGITTKHQSRSSVLVDVDFNICKHCKSFLFIVLQIIYNVLFW